MIENIIKRIEEIIEKEDNAWIEKHERLKEEYTELIDKNLILQLDKRFKGEFIKVENNKITYYILVKSFKPIYDDDMMISEFYILINTIKGFSISDYKVEKISWIEIPVVSLENAEIISEKDIFEAIKLWYKK